MAPDNTAMAELMQALISLAAAVISISIPLLVAYIHVRFKIANNSDLSRALATAADAAGRLADNFAAERGGYGNAIVKKAAIAWGAGHLKATMPQALLHFGSDPTALVTARIDVTVPPVGRPAPEDIKPPGRDYSQTRNSALPDPVRTRWIDPPSGMATPVRTVSDQSPRPVLPAEQNKDPADISGISSGSSLA